MQPFQLHKVDFVSFPSSHMSICLMAMMMMMMMIVIIITSSEVTAGHDIMYNISVKA